MNEGPGTTPSSAFRRELFQPGSARDIESETTFDDLPLPSVDDPPSDPITLSDEHDVPAPARRTRLLLGGTALAGLALAVTAGGLAMVAFAAAVATPGADATVLTLP